MYKSVYTVSSFREDISINNIKNHNNISWNQYLQDFLIWLENSKLLQDYLVMFTYVTSKDIKLRMEMENVSKRQQPDHRADNRGKPPMGLQCSGKLPHPEASFSWPLNKYVY